MVPETRVPSWSKKIGNPNNLLEKREFGSSIKVLTGVPGRAQNFFRGSFFKVAKGETTKNSKNRFLSVRQLIY